METSILEISRETSIMAMGNILPNKLGRPTLGNGKMDFQMVMVKLLIWMGIRLLDIFEMDVEKVKESIAIKMAKNMLVNSRETQKMALVLTTT